VSQLFTLCGEDDVSLCYNKSNNPNAGTEKTYFLIFELGNHLNF
ncbi:uncharacterized protein METZ01_LOCUS198837, partial [marine metagenome]